MDERDFTEVLLRAVELADGESDWHPCEIGDPDDENYRLAGQCLRREVTTYEGSRYRVVIIGPLR
jgi:hypothetical protein